jgi:hypothetical protein
MRINGKLVIAIVMAALLPAMTWSYLRTAPSPQSSVGGGAGIGQTIFCGATVACAGTTQSGVKVAYGSAPLTTGTPSTAVFTSLPFTSSSSYRCTVSDSTAVVSALYFVTYSSGSSFTVTAGTALTDTINYICIGT